MSIAPQLPSTRQISENVLSRAVTNCVAHCTTHHLWRAGQEERLQPFPKDTQQQGDRAGGMVGQEGGSLFGLRGAGFGLHTGGLGCWERDAG